MPLPELPHGLVVTGVRLEVGFLADFGPAAGMANGLPLRHLEDVISPVEPGRAQLRVAVAAEKF